MKFLLLLCTFSCVLISSSQIYTHSNSGMDLTFTGDCPVATCSGTYFDDGGAAGNYSPNINNITRTFCPDTPNSCMRLTLTYLDLENGFDYLIVRDGPAQGSPAIYSLTGNYGPIVPFEITSSNSSGCLTVQFFSDNIISNTGFAATLSCVACTDALPTGNSDCNTETQICANTAFNDVSNGPGTDLTNGCEDCIKGEIYSNWYSFLIQTDGTLSLDINPNTATDDFDYAIYGPNVDCSSLGEPIRCSFSDDLGPTGLNSTATDFSEDPTGDSYTRELDVIAGEYYYMMINKWTPGGAGFDLEWTGTASLDCTPLPVTLLQLRGEEGNLFNNLFWSTSSENNNSFFTLKRSFDGLNWEDIGVVSGAGNSNKHTSYSFKDSDIQKEAKYYYKLSQTDYDGVENDLKEIITLVNSRETPEIIKSVNMLGQVINNDSDEMRIIYYSDGTKLKKVGK